MRVRSVDVDLVKPQPGTPPSPQPGSTESECMLTVTQWSLIVLIEAAVAQIGKPHLPEKIL
jgi:hypothetical protein